MPLVSATLCGWYYSRIALVLVMCIFILSHVHAWASIIVLSFVFLPSSSSSSSSHDIIIVINHRRVVIIILTTTSSDDTLQGDPSLPVRPVFGGKDGATQVLLILHSAIIIFVDSRSALAHEAPRCLCMGFDLRRPSSTAILSRTHRVVSYFV